MVHPSTLVARLDVRWGQMWMTVWWVILAKCFPLLSIGRSRSRVTKIRCSNFRFVGLRSCILEIVLTVFPPVLPRIWTWSVFGDRFWWSGVEIVGLASLLAVWIITGRCKNCYKREVWFEISVFFFFSPCGLNSDSSVNLHRSDFTGKSSYSSFRGCVSQCSSVTFSFFDQCRN